MSELTIEDLQKQLQDAQAIAEQAKKDAEKQKGEAGKFKRLAEKFDGVDLDEISALKDKVSKFDGLEPEMIERLSEMQRAAADEKERELLKTGGVDALYEHRVKSERAENQKVIEALKAQAEAASAQVQQLTAAEKARKFEGEVNAAIKSHGKYLDGIEPMVSTYLRQYAKQEEDGVKYVVEGDTYYSPIDSTRPATTAEFISHKLPEIMPSLLKQSRGVGAQGSGSDGQQSENPFMQGARANNEAKQKLQRENPELAKRYLQEAIAAGKHPKI